MELFHLSVLEPWAGQLLDGSKRWEFRRNPAFGRDGDYELAPGDVLVLVAVGEKTRIAGQARVEELLRAEAMQLRFGDPEDTAWRESGMEGGHEDFCRKILNEYASALRLTVKRLDESIDVAAVRHAQTGKAWSGRGFGHLSRLKRYRLRGETPLDYFSSRLLFT